MDAVTEAPRAELPPEERTPWLARQLAEQIARMAQLISSPYTAYRMVQELGLPRLHDGSPLPSGVRRGRLRECFHNSIILALSRPERFVYCEGFAISWPVPFVVGLHAWCLDRERDWTVTELTWPGEEGAYLGVPICPHFLGRWLARSKWYGILNDRRVIGNPNCLGELVHPEEQSMPRDFAPEWSGLMSINQEELYNGHQEQPQRI